MRKLIIFLIVLIIVLVAVDRVAVAGVQRDIATRIAASSDLSGTPTVTIEGIPFLTQAIAGRYSEVRFDLGTLTYNTVKVDNLRGAAYDVTAPLADVVQNRAQITAGRVHVQGTLSRSTVDKFAPRGVKIGGSGDRLTASGEVDLGVTKVKFDAEMRVEVVDGHQAHRRQGQRDPLQVRGLPDLHDPVQGQAPVRRQGDRREGRPRRAGDHRRGK
ncbi:DUF2993 domain-containing protein [Nonomuraea dietziae]|uniref:LmeA family phospholipid-binding protein n=1 Tax=Nonomuraea dietziae TaxID=65515 RepID=UPI00361CDEBD